IPTDQANPTNLTASRADRFQHPLDLRPTLPVGSDIAETVWAAAVSIAHPRRSSGSGRVVVVRDRVAVEAIEEKGPHIAASRPHRRLDDGVGDGLEPFDPLPTLMTVEELQVVEVVLDSNCVVVTPAAVDDQAAFAWYAVQELRQIR